MNVLELARFAWKPNELRLMLVAMHCGGPVARARWVLRTGIPRNHLMAVMQEVERLGGCKLELTDEGVAVRVQPVSFWRVTPLCEAEVWAQCWREAGTARLDMATEARTLADALASVVSDKPGKASLARNPGNLEPTRPDSGRAVPGFRAAPRASDRDRDRSGIIEKEICLSRVPDRDRGDRDWLLEKLKSNMHEVRARGGVLYVLADADTHIERAEGMNVIRMPEHYGALSPLLHVVPLQLLAYHTACARGTDVDKPRNLAKSVTVE